MCRFRPAEGGGELTYHYDNLNRLVKQTVNGVPVEYSYDKYGRLVRKALMGFSGSPAVSKLKYFYDPDGTIIAREVNGVRQAYKYDRRGQLLEVVGQERYAYDPAGNILSKTVNGVTTTYRYDRANQLVSSETEGKVTKYAYDAAGRLVKEGNKSYTYAWLDKLVSVSEAGKVSANFSYHFDGQIAGVTYADGRRENYLWDGLALIHRDGTELLNEPAVTGGNPVLSGDKVLFNDMLGNTLGVKGKDAYQLILEPAKRIHLLERPHILVLALFLHGTQEHRRLLAQRRQRRLADIQRLQHPPQARLLDSRQSHQRLRPSRRRRSHRCHRHQKTVPRSRRNSAGLPAPSRRRRQRA